MAKESTQHKLDRVRKPRVQITYDVELNGAMQLKELPFVVGVLGDFTGKADQALPALKERKFIQIDRDNFDAVLASMNARVAFRADDKLSGKEGNQLNVELRLKSMDDFSPENVAQQVDPLRKLLEARDKLKNLLNRMDGNDKLEELLSQIVTSTETREQLGKSLGITGSGETSGEKES
jgi:type VI secretion system protein ImpB